tara:strand:+ start:430 stop:807 length:378 start_codon:yes stop_codon:yes gene_type:complete
MKCLSANKQSTYCFHDLAFWEFASKQISYNIKGSTVVEKEVKPVVKSFPKYKVLLHNDPINSMEYVVITLRQVVPQLSDQDALAIMLEAHNTGVGLVIVCDIEPAEFYSEALKAKGLTSTIEPEN